jgi:hypothetical protein
MASANKQQKRAKRAKDQGQAAGRIERQNPQAACPDRPGLFHAGLPQYPDDEDLDEDNLLLEMLSRARGPGRA